MDLMSNRTRTKTERLLAPEFWQGQRNFEDDSEVHARHMKPFCDMISIGETDRAHVTSLLIPFQIQDPHHRRTWSYLYVDSNEPNGHSSLLTYLDAIPPLADR
jgi:hypothetical protein